MPSSLPSSPRDVRLGGHELLLELAAGGMAKVYVARKVGAAGFERLVVVKRVHQSLVENREFADMFRDEARICATIRHPNVVPILDVVESDGELFLVLEYVESLALSALTKAAEAQGKPMPPDVVVRIVADALAGLHAAHEAKDLRGNRLELIHRDVSPQNIIVGLDGSSRLIDFGIAKAASRVSVTTSGVLKGKLSYMSPEQVRRRPLDRRADVFAAGVVLFEALTGRKPFLGDDEGDVVLGILIAEIPAPSSLVPGLSRELDEVVMKSLARDREERYQTASEFEEALERACTPAPDREVTRVVETFGGAMLEERRARLRAHMEETSGRHAAASPEGAPVPTRSERPARAAQFLAGSIAGRLVRVVVAFLLLAGVATAAVLVERNRNRSSPAPAAATSAFASEAVGVGTSPVAATGARDTPVFSAAPVAVPPPAPASQRPWRQTPSRELHRRNPYGQP